MDGIKNHKLYRLFLLLSKKRKKQIYILIILIIINGIFESLSITTIVPFLELITSKGDSSNLLNIKSYIPIYSTNPNQILLFFTVLFCIFILFASLLRIFNNWYILRLTAKIDVDLANLIYKTNIYQKYKDYTKKSSSKVISLIVEKVSVSASALNALFTILLSLIIASSIVISLLIFNWKIVIFSFIFLYIYYLFIIRNVRKILMKNGEIISINDPLRIKIIQESFMGFRDIIINNTEKIYSNLFTKYHSILKIKSYDSQFLTTTPKFLIEAISILIIAIIGYIFSISSSENKNFLPVLGSFVYALQRLLPLTQQTYAAWASYKIKSASINDVLKEIEKVNIRIKKIEDPNVLAFDKNITLTNISYNYDNSNFIFKDISVEINKGDHIGVYGETGSGKSTFLDILMGLLPPENGFIAIDGVDIYKNKLQDYWSSKISHVSQNIFLKEGSIAENIAFGESPKTIDYFLLEKASHISGIYNFIKNTANGFETMVGERGIRLSGGQKQRIAIARAIYRIKDVLVLDESTSALDEKMEKKIIKSILNNYNDVTIVMVTHRMKSLENCNRIFEVKSGGKLIEKNPL